MHAHPSRVCTRHLDAYDHAYMQAVNTLNPEKRTRPLDPLTTYLFFALGMLRTFVEYLQLFSVVVPASDTYFFHCRDR